MDFKGLSKAGKIRTVVFLAVAALLIYWGVASVAAFREYQLRELIDAPNNKVTFDGEDFTFFFVAEIALLNGVYVVIMLLAYFVAVLLVSAVAAVLLRVILLRRAWDVKKDEFNICSRVYACMAIVGVIISLIITRGGMVVTTVLYLLPPVLIVAFVYLLPLDRRSITSGHGHFVQGTQQDLTDL